MFAVSAGPLLSRLLPFFLPSSFFSMGTYSFIELIPPAPPIMRNFFAGLLLEPSRTPKRLIKDIPSSFLSSGGLSGAIELSIADWSSPRLVLCRSASSMSSGEA